MDLTAAAAIVYTFVTCVVIAFQVALAAGAPWGAFAMGGRFPGMLPPGMRVAAVVQALLLALLAGVVLSRAGIAVPGLSARSATLIWAVVAFALVSVVMNSISPSRGERRIWVPVALVLLASSLTVALTT